MPGRMHRAISATGRYCVNVLPDHGRDLSRHFASQPNTGASPDYEIVDGLPHLSGCIAWFACEVTRHVDVSGRASSAAFVATNAAAPISTYGLLREPEIWGNDPVGKLLAFERTRTSGVVLGVVLGLRNG
jgi:hypothetical protein